MLSLVLLLILVLVHTCVCGNGDGNDLWEVCMHVKCKVQIVSLALQFPVHYRARPDRQDSNYHIVILMRSRHLGFWSDELMV